MGTGTFFLGVQRPWREGATHLRLVPMFNMTGAIPVPFLHPRVRNLFQITINYNLEHFNPRLFSQKMCPASESIHSYGSEVATIGSLRTRRCAFRIAA
jgi:hypothetical protein